jgi:hypothetical protein
VAFRTTTAVRGLSIPVYAAPGDWFSWTIMVRTAGDFRVTATADRGGTAGVFVDGSEIGRGPSETPAGGVVRLTAGVHTVRVQSVGGWFLIRGVTLDRLDSPAP